MGSNGTGQFSDYSNSQNSGSNKEGDGSGSGSSGTDRCNLAFSCKLEEIEQCKYFETYKSSPPTGTKLSLTLSGRIMAMDEAGLSVGALPTSHNFIADCIRSGYSYLGTVSASSDSPVATAQVDFAPEKP